ncbi:GNAT family N-acetyltransferase [Streptomyces hawaiiensis]|uniref:GNAT family N-acetyltransferase n=1 Tax=Streptomyces hawaiiensis TaxID=67305 RepID=UPI0036564F72
MPEVFTAPPWEPRDVGETRAEFRERLATDVRRPGFQAVLALAEDGGVDGFATGWITPAPFRADRAYGKVTRRLGADRVNELLVGSFEIDELGVRSRARGTGLGQRLLSALSHGAVGRRSWLMTWNGAPDALAFYRRLGWWEPDPVPGEETDVVVFVAPAPEGDATGFGAQASGQ